MRVAFYVRVSSDEQMVENQLRDLRAVAESKNWTITKIYADQGLSGAKGREGRPGLDQLMTDVQAGHFDMVAAWSVDRLGRSMRDLINFLVFIQEAKVELYLHKQNLDTSTPSGRLLFGMLGLIAEFERAILIERTNAGLARAKAAGKRLGKAPPTPELLGAVKARYAGGGISAYKIAKEFGLSHRTIWRYLAA